MTLIVVFQDFSCELMVYKFENPNDLFYEMVCSCNGKYLHAAGSMLTTNQNAFLTQLSNGKHGPNSYRSNLVDIEGISRYEGTTELVVCGRL